MEWELSIPKIFHVYWGGGIMPYIRFLTVKSFMKYNPDWEIIFWHPKYVTPHITWLTGELCYPVDCDDYTSEMLKLPIKTIAVDFNDIGFNNMATEVHKSDFLRLHLLTTLGGVWSDMDILYFRSINILSINVKENKDIETVVCISDYGHSTGFLMSKPGSVFFQLLLNIIKNRPIPQEYQAIGPTLYNGYFRDINLIKQLSPTINLGMDVVYSHDAGLIPDFLSDIPPKFSDETIGAHWYAGHPQWEEFFKVTNGGLINLPNSIIGNLIKKINEE